MNGTLVKNQLILDFASGSLSPSKSIFTSTYLFLNAKASRLNIAVENILGNELFNNNDVPVASFDFKDCISSENKGSKEPKKDNVNLSPLSKIVGPLRDINWKQIYRGFSEFSLDLNDNEELKLIKMDPGVSVPLHSHNGKEYILVLSGSFKDEYGTYSKGDLQINDQEIKHTPIASEKEGCICLTISEKDVVFFGRLGSFLNLFTFIKSFFK
tara:strand:+ start:66 stop:704 length:639 start_codon:yes stop_codon:yes gene_type:complete